MIRAAIEPSSDNEMEGREADLEFEVGFDSGGWTCSLPVVCIISQSTYFLSLKIISLHSLRRYTSSLHHRRSLWFLLWDLSSWEVTSLPGCKDKLIMSPYLPSISGFQVSRPVVLLNTLSNVFSDFSRHSQDHRAGVTWPVFVLWDEWAGITFPLHRISSITHLCNSRCTKCDAWMKDWISPNQKSTWCLLKLLSVFWPLGDVRLQNRLGL